MSSMLDTDTVKAVGLLAVVLERNYPKVGLFAFQERLREKIKKHRSLF
jgi:hypothetical protein